MGERERNGRKGHGKYVQIEERKLARTAAVLVDEAAGKVAAEDGAEVVGRHLMVLDVRMEFRHVTHVD